MRNKKQETLPAKSQELKLPAGVKLLRALEGHTGAVISLAFDPTGSMLASGALDNTVRLWDAAGGSLLRTLEGHNSYVLGVTFDSSGRTVASASSDRTVLLWDAATGRLLRRLDGHRDWVRSVAFDPTGRRIVSGGDDKMVRLWDAASGDMLCTLANYGYVLAVAFDPSGRTFVSAGNANRIKVWDADGDRLLRALEGYEDGFTSLVFDPSGGAIASASFDGTVLLWDAATGRLLRRLEGHTSYVESVAFSGNGRLLASKSYDGTLRLWDCRTWETVAVIPEDAHQEWFSSLAFHPALPLLASAGSNPGAPLEERSKLIHIWELDFDVLLGEGQEVEPAREAKYHTTAKIVLVGDSGVGKTGLGWRLAHGEYKEHSSTHGQQFWVLDELGERRKDGTECEAILWDLAGQPDYRLTHALFLDDADLALVLFDPTDGRDPLHGVEFWLRQLRSGRGRSGASGECCPTVLVGARADRGEARLTLEELEEFCRRSGIRGGYLATSAKENVGLEELMRRMRELIPWEGKAATVTTVTFKRIKDYVLGLKETAARSRVIVSPEELRALLRRTDGAWEFTDAEMMTAVGHLANYGYVRVLRTSRGEERVLLAPELLNNLAASFVLEARRNPKGLGALEEERLLAREYEFRELEPLSEEERDVLIDSAALLFLEHNVCFRETDLNEQSYLVFPELINLKKPLPEDEPMEDGAAYTVSGAVENVYASLVVLLGYTRTFTRTNQWQNHARYVMGRSDTCGFRQEASHEGELELVLYFGAGVPKPGRKIFEGLVEKFLARRDVSVFRYEPVSCPGGHRINLAVVRTRLRDGKDFAFCEECGGRVLLPRPGEPVQLTRDERRKVEEQQRVAERRTRFEQAVFQLKTYVESQKLARPLCFVSYAWGDPEQERWVERALASDLQNAGVGVVLDRWENERVGASVSRFVERVERCDRVLVVGTPFYREKYENRDPRRGYVAAAEFDVISNRLLDTEQKKETVLPLLLAGEKEQAFPPLLHGRVHADFRDERAYFMTAFDLILDIYGIPHHHPAVADLRDSLREPERFRM